LGRTPKPHEIDGARQTLVLEKSVSARRRAPRVPASESC
jgi:hypothetical protein